MSKPSDGAVVSPIKQDRRVFGGGGGGLCTVTGKSHERKGLMFMHLDPLVCTWRRDHLGSKTNKSRFTALTKML